MDRDTIIRLAREEGDVEADTRGRETFSFDSYGVERFAALVAAHEREQNIHQQGILIEAAVLTEREACAKVCDEHAKKNYNWASENADIYHAQAHWAGRCAAAIRNRT